MWNFFIWPHSIKAFKNAAKLLLFCEQKSDLSPFLCKIAIIAQKSSCETLISKHYNSKLYRLNLSVSFKDTLSVLFEKSLFLFEKQVISKNIVLLLLCILQIVVCGFVSANFRFWFELWFHFKMFCIFIHPDRAQNPVRISFFDCKLSNNGLSNLLAACRT